MKQFYFFRYLLLLLLGITTSALWGQTTFNYTGALQTYTVPPGVTSIQIETWGAQGQSVTVEQYNPSIGGLGGFASGEMSVNPGDVFNIYVGGMGSEGASGYNGGEIGGYGTPSDGDEGHAGSGGGASDVRFGGATLIDRIIVAGGGGGGGRDYVNGTCQPCGTGGNGGAGGGYTGIDGVDPADAIYNNYFNPGSGGKGGTPISGGLGGNGTEGVDGNPGQLGIGGIGISGSQSVASGGGGGGYYGGGSGGGVSNGSGAGGAGGAGGSSYTGALINASTNSGIRTGNGQIVITPLCNAPVATCQDLTVQLDASGNASITAAQIDNGSVADCGLAALSVSPSTFTCEEVGVNTVTLTVTDNNGGTATCTATVTVQDLVPPVAICQDITVQLGADGTVTIDASEVDNGSSDACGLFFIGLDETEFTCADVGIPQTVTLGVIDNNFNSSSCTATVTVQDLVPPVALCQDMVVQLDASGSASIAGIDVDGGSTDNCDTDLLYAVTPNTFTCEEVGTNTVTLTVTDDYNNSSTCTATVTVEDNIPPVITCPTNMVVSTSPDDCEACEFIPIISLPVTLNYASRVITYTGVSINGGSNTASVAPGASVSLAYNMSVAFNTSTGYCPGCVVQSYIGIGGTSTTLQCESSIYNGYNNSYSSGSFVAPTLPGVYYLTQSGSLDYSCQPRNFNNSYSNAIGVIRVGEVTDFPMATATDNCEVLSVVSDHTGCYPMGDTLVTWTATDVNGNVSTCETTVTVEDITPPEALCNNIIVQLDATGNASITAEEIDNESSDACGIASVAIDVDTFTCEDVGDKQVVLTVTDVNDNVSTCTATVTVEDNVPPVALCQDITIQLDAAGQASITADQIDNGSNDACGIASLVLDTTEFSCEDVTSNSTQVWINEFHYDNSGGDVGEFIEIAGTAGVDLTGYSLVLYNGNGGSSYNTIALSGTLDDEGDAFGALDFAISGIQNGAPDGFALVDPSNMVLEFFSYEGSFTANDGPAIGLTSTDVGINEPSSTLIGDSIQRIGSGTSGASFSWSGPTAESPGSVNMGQSFAAGVGVTLTVTDNNGNQSTCEAIVSVQDNIAPEALCQPLIIELDVDGNASITAEQIDNGSNDACGIASLVLDTTDFTCEDVGENTVTLTVTDVNNNFSTCESTVTVQDNIAPEALCQPVTVQLDDMGNASITADQIDNGSNDACGIDLICLDGSSTFSVMGTLDTNGTTFDYFGDGRPEEACFEAASFGCCGLVAGTHPYTTDVITITQGGTYTFTLSDINSNIDFSAALYTAPLNPLNICENLVANDDDSAGGLDPEIVITVTVVPGTYYLTTFTWGTSDDFPAPYNWDISSMGCMNEVAFTCEDVGENTLTLSVTDVNGNVSICETTVTVEDNVAPVALCQALTLELDVNGEGSITAEEVDNGSNDACGIASLELDTYDFTCEEVGENTVTLLVTDVNGNESTCESTITVQDNIAPEAICQDITVYLDELGNVSITAADVDNGSNDACGIASLEIDVTDFDCSNVNGQMDNGGEPTVVSPPPNANRVVLTVTDVNGNVSTCESYVTVIDNIPPEALCQSIVVELDEEGNVSITPEQIDNGSNDACGIESLMLDITDFTCEDVGDNPVILTVTDVNGNSSTCEATVTVEDNVPPVVLCSDITVQLDENGEAYISTDNFQSVLTISSDNDSTGPGTTDFTVPITQGMTITFDWHYVTTDVDGSLFDTFGYLLNGAYTELSDADGANDQSGTTSVLLAPGDVFGFRSYTLDNIAGSSVTTVNNFLPSFYGQFDPSNWSLTLVNSDGTAYFQPIATDACGIASLDVDLTDFSCEDIGENTATITAVDVNGNEATCSATVTVEDSLAPVADVTDLPALADYCSVALPEITATDNCAGSVVGIPDIPFPITDPGTVLVTWTFEDAYGNISTQTQYVTINDPSDPALQDVDSDGDGYTNGEELEMGSDPCDVCDPGPAIPTGAAEQLFCTADYPEAPALVGDIDVTAAEDHTLNYYDAAGNPIEATAVLVTGVYVITQTNEFDCESHTGLLVTVTVSETPAAPVAESPQIFCTDDMPTIADIAISGITLGNMVTWYDTMALTGELSEMAALVDGMTYYVTQTNGDTCESAATAVMVTVSTNPEAPIGVAEQLFCIAADYPTPTFGDIDAMALEGNTLNYYDTAGNEFASTDSLVSGTYAITQTNEFGCESAGSLVVDVTVSDTPAAPVAESPQIFCTDDMPTIADLVISGIEAGNLVTWYDVDMNVLVETMVLVDGMTYYVSQTNDDTCESATTAIEVTVSVNPAAPTGPAVQLFCTADYPTPTFGDIDATALEGNTLNYYDTAENEFASTDTLVSGMYVITQTNEFGCESTRSLVVTVTVSETPEAPVADSPQAFCSEDLPTIADIAISGIEAGNLVTWYDVDMNVLAETTVLVDGMTYYVSQTNDDTCESATTAIDVTVSVNPDAPTGVAEQLFCTADYPSPIMSDIDATATGSNILHYYDSVGNELEATDTLVSGTYAITQSNEYDCESTTSLLVEVTVSETPGAPVGPSDQLFCSVEEMTVGDLEVAADLGNYITWYDAAVDGEVLDEATLLTTGMYYASQTNPDTCESVELLAVTVTVTQTPGAPEGAAEQSFCASDYPTVGDLAVTADEENAITWYDASGNELNLTDMLQDGVSYFASQTTEAAPNCESVDLLEVVVEVVTVTIPTGEATQEFCVGDMATVADLVAEVDLNDSYNWYDLAEGGDMYMLTDLLVDGMYYAEAVNEDACLSLERFAVEVILNPDCDNDGVLDVEEVDGNTDGDAFVDYMDPDDDDDGVLTIDEDSNFDGDWFNDDCNENGLVDYLDPRTCDLIPTGFSPGEVDGVNDTWVIPILEQYPNFILEVYDRYGNLVYDYKNAGSSSPQWWDGRSNGRWTFRDGELLPAGTYFYIINFNQDEKQPKTGWVYLNR